MGTDHGFQIDRDDVAPPHAAVRTAVAIALGEDLLPVGDLTAMLVPADALGRADLVARSPGVLSGSPCVFEVCAQVDPGLVFSPVLEDGACVEQRALVGRLSGPFRSLLTAERTALNFLCHLSGVATLTRRYVEAATAENPNVRVLDTRKTTPGLRALERATVRAGGGFNHRGSLSEGVLIKDNHLGHLSIKDAVALAKRRWPGRLVEVECDNEDQVRDAVLSGASAVLCDNMHATELHRCVVIAHDIGGNAPRCLVEASGGVTLETIGALAATGVDLISVGALTHSAPSLDIGLDLEI